MIDISTGGDVDRLLNRVVGHPKRYAEVTLCSPFIDERTLNRVLPLLQIAGENRCAVRVITSPEAAERLRNRLKSDLRSRDAQLIESPRLHAKIYFAVARCGNDTEAIVTSANLTNAGIHQNIELGVRATPTSTSGRRLLYHVRHFIKRLAA